MQEPSVLYATTRKGLDLGLRASSKDILIKYPKLDICDSTSINSLAESIKKDHAGVDVLINNADVNLEHHDAPENKKRTLDTNYRGNLEVDFVLSISPCHAERS